MRAEMKEPHPNFKSGVRVNYKHGRKDKTKTCPYLRISAGVLRGVYVHVLVIEAKLGRKLRDDETVEHMDGDGLNAHPDNLIVVTRARNSELRHERERNRKAESGAVPEVAVEDVREAGEEMCGL